MDLDESSLQDHEQLLDLYENQQISRQAFIGAVANSVRSSKRTRVLVLVTSYVRIYHVRLENQNS